LEKASAQVRKLTKINSKIVEQKKTLLTKSTVLRMLDNRLWSRNPTTWERSSILQ